MERLKRDKARMHIIARLSMISAVASAPLTIGAILLLWYIPMGFAIALAIHGFYLTPFYYRRHEDLARLEIILAEREFTLDDAALAERAAVSTEYVGRLLALAERKGYSAPDLNV